MIDSDVDAATRDTIDAFQTRSVQTYGGDVPRVPFVIGHDGTLHELVEEDARTLDPDVTKQNLGKAALDVDEQGDR